MTNKDKKFRVYVLVDPTDGVARYIGITSCLLLRRLTRHLTDACLLNRLSSTSANGRGYRHFRNKEKDHWLRHLMLKGLVPVIYPVSGKETKQIASKLERNLIKSPLMSAPLFNIKSKISKPLTAKHKQAMRSGWRLKNCLRRIKQYEKDGTLYKPANWSWTKVVKVG